MSEARVVEFVVPGQPVAKARTRSVPLKQCTKCHRKTARRVCLCGSREMDLITILAVTDKDCARYENLVAMAAKEAIAGKMFEGPVRVTLGFSFVPAPSRKNLCDEDTHEQRPDVDNCLKSILDGLNRVAYADDCRVCEVFIRKQWFHNAGVAVRIENIPKNPNGDAAVRINWRGGNPDA